MSRIGRKPIVVPSGVKVDVSGRTVTVTGPKGTLKRDLPGAIVVAVSGDSVNVTRPSDSKTDRSLHGLCRTLVANMVEGVSTGFRKNLEINGVGYRAAKSGNKLTLALGYSHPIEIVPPAGISFEVDGQTKVSVIGYDKEAVGQIAAEIRSLRKPEPYKGKGIKYEGETVRRKAGKAGKVGAK
ncbi:MAG: 50S ribosomal protein L6 [Candidatus Limnocylindrus sp.]|jgi:large subunit ribosomal protein L6|nr:MAG: 50S ribosomal protein L6 [Chloroflexota bacterium]RLT29476.1 MAG: 50S ribosomal protein L6 [Chloroflexota bacterium]